MRELGKRKLAEVFRKSARLWKSKERKSAEGSEKHVKFVAPAEEVWGALRRPFRIKPNENHLYFCKYQLDSPSIWP